MEGVSAALAGQNLMMSVLAQTQSQDQLSTAVLQRAQEVQQQQGSAVVALIEAAGSALVDVRV
ncbi:MAG: hypothetical protein CVV27_16935 [Candidatus Melainabacteria bacterium HGW-Melainabacteria-1]|nr:MAG: hypothetical protein CVV27_16935 [Candidatus Melainabacteria bacterium HGW-Melainabacteria-1]